MTGVSAACTDLLAQARRFSPEYGDGLANHLPMALIALDRMGADAATMQRFFARYSRRLEPAGDASGPADPLQLLGTGAGCAPLARHFHGLIEADGVDPVLRHWLPLLMPGVAASAFHGLIRLAYAIDARDQAEIALALAYWSTEYLALPLSGELADARPAQLARQLAQATRGHVFAPGNIGSRITQMARHPALAAAALQPAELSFAAIGEFGLAAYCEREDFTLLHIVTACHAYRLVQPYVGDSKAAVRHLWRAVVVAWLTTDPADAGQAEDVGAIQIDAGTLRMLCCAAADDHTIKLGYSALCEYRDSGDARYLQAAYRKAAPKTAVTP
jgi:hypothetical protein